MHEQLLILISDYKVGYMGAGIIQLIFRFSHISYCCNSWFSHNLWSSFIIRVL